MENRQNTRITLGRHFKILIIDFTVIFFLFTIVRFLISSFCFLSFLPDFFILWLSYYIISLGIWRQTLGGCFFGVYMINQNNRDISWTRVIMRELFTSLPGVLLIVFYFVYYPSKYLRELSSPMSMLIIAGGALIILFALSIITLLRVKIFKLKLANNALVGELKALKYARKRVVIVYSIFLLLAGISRYCHTCFTNDIEKVKTSYSNLPLTSNPKDINTWAWDCFTAPRPMAASVKEYTNFLSDNRQNINDYILSLYNQYDHVILCERIHPEMSQYDMIYDIVTDSRFTDKVGVVFTEIGNVDSREGYRALANTNFPNDTVFQQTLSSFMMENESFHLFWNNTNWFEFLKKMYYFNRNKEKKVEILFTDRANWVHNDTNYQRDKFMADNIISTIRKDTLKKSLTIMNYRHAYLKGDGNCGYYVAREFPGKVANVLINTIGWDFLPLQNGKWDVAFEQMPENAFAFNLKDSPFGKDRFDHYIFLSPLTQQRYENMFTGLIYYKPLSQHFFGDGFPYMMQAGNIRILRERAAKLNEPFHEDYYRSLGDGKIRGAKLVYFSLNLLENIFFIWNFIWGLGILVYLSFVYLRSSKPTH